MTKASTWWLVCAASATSWQRQLRSQGATDQSAIGTDSRLAAILGKQACGETLTRSEMGYMGSVNRKALRKGSLDGQLAFTRTKNFVRGRGVEILFAELDPEAARLDCPGRPQWLGVKPCTTERQCYDALASRLVVFYPRPMFPPRLGENFEGADCRALRWFCTFVLGVSRSGAGRKVFLIDELRRFIPSRSDLIPLEVDQIFREGRIENIELVLSTQYPRDFAKTIREEVTEWICFNINEPDNLDAVRPYFPAVDAVAGLARGEFIAYNRESGAQRRGKLF